MRSVEGDNRWVYKPEDNIGILFLFVGLISNNGFCKASSIIGIVFRHGE